MKKGRRVHPSSPAVDEKLTLLPISVAGLAAGLPEQDREVLSYLVSCGSSDGAGGVCIEYIEENKKKNKKKNKNKKKASPATAAAVEETHVPQLGCTCFSCYKSFWARWDSSPNGHVIDKALEVFEESVVAAAEEKEEKRKPRRCRRKSGGSPAREEEQFLKNDSVSNIGVDNYDSNYCDNDDKYNEGNNSSSSSSSSVSRLISFIGEKVLGGVLKLQM